MFSTSEKGRPDAICYARFSPRPRIKRGLAVDIDPAEKIELQQELNRAYCEWAGLNPRYEISEPYTSAYELDLAERPRGADLVKLFEGGVKHIVAPKLDRIFRNTRDGLYWLDEGFPKYKVTLHIADQRGVALRTNTADGYLTAVMLLTMATIEPMRTRERTKHAMRAHQRNGRSMGGHSPYGQARDQWGGLIDAPEEIVIRDEILSLAKCMTPATIATTLNERGTPARNGTRWHPEKIRRIIQRHKEPNHA